MTISTSWITVSSALACGLALVAAPSTAEASGPRACTVPAHSACVPSSLTAGSEVAHSDDPQVLFLNFDDVTLTVGDDDAPNNTTYWDDLAGTWTGYPEWTEEARQVARDRVATIFAPFDIVVTVTRPESGNYTMVVVGQHGDFSGGFSTEDCDNQNPNTVAFVAARPEGLSDYNLMAHEAGHSFGLAHTETELDEIMNPVVWDESELGTECAPRSSDYCDEFLQMHCSVGEQNSHATLCGTLGPWDPGEECELKADPQPDPSDTTGGDTGDTAGDTGDDDPGEEDDTGGGEGPTSADDTGAADDPLPGGTGDTGGEFPDGDGDGSSDEGCGCTTGPSQPGSVLFSLILLGGIRWRHRHTVRKRRSATT